MFMGCNLVLACQTIYVNKAISSFYSAVKVHFLRHLRWCLLLDFLVATDVIFDLKKKDGNKLPCVSLEYIFFDVVQVLNGTSLCWYKLTFSGTNVQIDVVRVCNGTS